jgi:hypothetical protein
LPPIDDFQPVFKFDLFQYYHEESGVYIGPARTFDDDDLEYLNKDDTEDINDYLQKIKPSPPISSLSIDSLSGIYLGFAEKEKHEEKGNETGDVHDINETLVSEESKVTEKSSPRLGRFFLKMRKQCKQAADVPDQVPKQNVCFKLFRK